MICARPRVVMRGGVYLCAGVITNIPYFLPRPLRAERERDRVGGGGGLKYDSHYGGYNLVAFFTDFMTAASYSRPIGARHRHKEELGEERVTERENI